MATTFVTVTAWMLDRLYPQREDGGRNPAGVPYIAPAGYTWQRDRYTVELHRDGAGWSAFTPLVNTTLAGGSIGWTGGNDTLAGSGTYTYTCIENYVVPLEPGFWREYIVWEWFSEWEEVEASAESPL